MHKQIYCLLNYIFLILYEKYSTNQNIYHVFNIKQLMVQYLFEFINLYVFVHLGNLHTSFYHVIYLHGVFYNI